MDTLVGTLMDLMGFMEVWYSIVWYGIGQWNLEWRMLLEFCLEKELNVSNKWSKREENRKATFRMGENETEIDIVSIKKEH